MTDHDVETLQSLLAQSPFPTLPLDRIHGLFSALAAGPDFIPQSIWIPIVFMQREDLPDMDNDPSFDSIIKNLVHFYQLTESSLEKGEFTPVVRSIQNRNKTEIDVHDWCTGFVLGIECFGDQWMECSAREIRNPTLAILYLADPTLMTNSMNKTSKAKLDSFQDDLKMDLQHIVYQIAQYWNNIDHSKPANQETTGK